MLKLWQIYITMTIWILIFLNSIQPVKSICLMVGREQMEDGLQRELFITIKMEEYPMNHVGLILLN